MASKSIAIDDDVYELSPTELGDSMDQWRSTATYTLEVPVRCPYCDERIHGLRIVGLTRSQVAFTSTLPEWVALEDHTEAPMGQKLWLVDGDEFPILELRELDVTPAAAAKA